MKNLLVIFNVAAEDDVCRLFLPYWQRSGCDILFSSPFDAKSQLDDVLHFHTGRAMTKARSSWWWYQARVLETMRALNSLPYDEFIFTQYDSIALDELPDLTGRCCCHVFQNDDSAYKAKIFVHPPWCFTHDGLDQFIGHALHHPIQTSEHGVMDRWMAWVLESAGIPVTPTNDWSWSANSIDTPALAQDCRNAIARGCRFIHGCKNASQLASILPP